MKLYETGDDAVSLAVASFVASAISVGSAAEIGSQTVHENAVTLTVTIMDEDVTGEWSTCVYNDSTVVYRSPS